jgi:glycerol kinase
LRDSATFALEGNVFSSGATVEWVAKLLGLKTALEVEQLARGVPSTGGVHIVPGFAGLGAPYWRSDVRGQISGITFGTGAAELARAAIESIAFQVADLVRALERDVDRPVEELRVDGGATRNEVLRQLQADLLGCTVVRTGARDAAALGAAFLAGLATGIFDSEEHIEAIGRRGERIEPKMAAHHREELLSAWHQALSRALEPQRDEVFE